MSKRSVMACIPTLLLLLSAVGSHVGCVTTMADARAGKGSGTSKIYDKPYDVVWKAVVDSVESSGLNRVSERRDAG